MSLFYFQNFSWDRPQISWQDIQVALRKHCNNRKAVNGLKQKCRELLSHSGHLGIAYCIMYIILFESLQRECLIFVNVTVHKYFINANFIWPWMGSKIGKNVLFIISGNSPRLRVTRAQKPDLIRVNEQFSMSSIDWL